MGATLVATPAQLGAITLARALAQAAASPLAGALGDSCDRVRLVAAGCGLWALCTAGIACAGSLGAMLPLAAFNGVGLALAIPCVQSIVADAVAAPRRGSAFGLVGTAAGLGGMAAAWGATSAARASLFGGVAGWRVAFGAVAALSAGVGLAVLAFAEDPRVTAAAADAAAAANAAAGGGGGPHPQQREVALVTLSTRAGSGGLAAASSYQPPPSPRRQASGGAAGSAGLMAGGKHAASLASAGSGGRFPWAAAGMATGGPGRDEEAALLPALGSSSLTTPPSSPRLTNGKEGGHALRPTASLGSAAGFLAAAEAAAMGGGGGGGGGAPTLAASIRAGLGRAGAAAGAVLRVRSFRVLVAQGVAGSMPWQALLYSTLYLQLLGFPDSEAGALSAAFAAACAAGGLIGGAAGDAAARAWPDGGRIAVSQFSVAAGLPLTWILLRAVPGSAACAVGGAGAGAGAGAAGTGVFAGNAGPAVAPGAGCGSAMAAAMVATGLFISWCGSNNSAIFADVVPAHLRSTVYAFDRAFEGAVAATATPLVGWLAAAAFGFRGSLADVGGAGAGSAAADAARARALGSSLLVLTCGPWVACFAAYLLLYRAYPPDKRRAARAAAAGGRLVVAALPVAVEHGGAFLVTPPASPRPPALAPIPTLNPSPRPAVAAAAEAHGHGNEGGSDPPTPRLVTLEDAYALIMRKKEEAASGEASGDARARTPPPPPPVSLGSGGVSGGHALNHHASRPLSRSGASLPRTPVRRGGSGSGAWGSGPAPPFLPPLSPGPPASASLGRAPSAPDGSGAGWGALSSPRGGRRRSLDLLKKF
jgi:MFS family permease